MRSESSFAGVALRRGLLGPLLVLIANLSAPVRASDLGLIEADCRCCHGPTLADRHHLMVISRDYECLLCHQLTWHSETLEYGTVVTRNCLQCHTGSLADRHHLLVDQVTFNCFTCHTLTWDPVSVTLVPAFNASCKTSPPPPAAAIVNGIVRGTSGKGLAWVRVSTNSGGYSALTTAAGAFQLADIAPGSYVIAASADGYVTASRAVTVAAGQTATVDLVLSRTIVSPAIKGQVVDGMQIPIEGASVVADDGLSSALTGVDGGFVLTNLAPGSHIVTAGKRGYGSSEQIVSVALGQVVTVSFALPSASSEVCGDRLDNDGNGLTDCADPACSSTPACGPPVEICSDGLDNDANGLVDCGDPTCMGTVSCPSPPAEFCGDGLDNDADGLADCADRACAALALCSPENCSDTIDNNGDGLVDCADPACVGTSKCLEPPVEICDDGLDNDTNGQVDCADGKCLSSSVCAQPGDGGHSARKACEYIVQSDWDTGFTAVIRIRNAGAALINGWEVSWAYTDGSIINNHWSANFSGSNPYGASGLSWNAVLSSGQGVEFGMVGQKANHPAQVPVVSGARCSAGGGLRCTYTVQGEWGAGFTASIQLTNEGAAPIDGWSVRWEYTDGSLITNLWSAAVSGSNPYEASNLSWNRVIGPGQSVVFGMNGQKVRHPAQVPAVSGAVCGQ